MEVFPANYHASNGLCANGPKRMKLQIDGRDCGGVGASTIKIGDSKVRKSKTSLKVIDYSDPFAVNNMIETLDAGKYGSVTKEIEEIATMRMDFVKRHLSIYPSLLSVVFAVDKSQNKDGTKKENQQASDAIIILEDNADNTKNGMASKSDVVIIDSDDEEENGNNRPRYPFQSSFLQCQIRGVVPQYSSMEAVPQYPFQEVVLGKGSEQLLIRGTADGRNTDSCIRIEGLHVGDTNTGKDKGVYVGVEYEDDDDVSEKVDDGLGDIWNEMAMAIECSKDATGEASIGEQMPEEEEEDCEHSYVLKDDIGYVCRVCGVIDRRIDEIIDVQFSKVKRSTRSYASESRNAKDNESSEMIGIKFSKEGFIISGISAHPRHMQQMKPHQIEGFNFLCSNLVSDNPGGCILAHAPGSGKTFMIISFMQSFLAKYPHARPLVVLPKGILSTWKREFLTWQVEDIPLLDLYSAKADSRPQQLEILKQWIEEKSILFLGYKQFSTIVCATASNRTSVACQEILLKAPSILILDEGHTPRNENTDVLQSLAKVQTPRKVVLSGTLYQNHVKEVFNILNLVRPKFLKLDTSKSVVKRILSRAPISSVRKHLKAGADVAFYDIVEHTLQKDEDFKMRVSVIQDLREMTRKVLHYYKGDFLDELPGLIDFTVVLNLTPKQKNEVRKLKKFERKFKVCSVGSAIYLHPKLKSFSEKSEVSDSTMDEMLEKLDVKEGVKAKFFLSMINLCDSAGEKLLVFSQYLIPLKFLERLAVTARGWKVGKEIFVITGESSAEQREWSMDRFNNSRDAKLFFGSIKACGEGISLVGASRILILDVHLNPSVTRQAIGRVFRPGQKKKVHAYRLVAAESPEEDDHKTCFKKEVISKMWFEWNEYCGYRDFEVERLEVDECGDMFLESSTLKEDVKTLYKR